MGKNWAHAEVCPEPLQTFKMERFWTKVYCFIIVAKPSILDVCGGPDYASDMGFCVLYVTEEIVVSQSVSQITAHI